MLTQPPGTAFASGQFNHVPVISGSNHDEYRLFVALNFDYRGNPLTDADYPAATLRYWDCLDRPVRCVRSGPVPAEQLSAASGCSRAHLWRWGPG